MTTPWLNEFRIAVAPTKGRHFDLNIEKFLEGWGPPHAIRELIANALDEQALTGTTNVEITKDSRGIWHTPQ